MDSLILQKNELGNIQSSLDYFLTFNISKNVKILDVGCNYGSLVYNLYKLGYKNVFGVDINKSSIIEGKKKYKEISNNLFIQEDNKLIFNNNSFDIVLMFDVIEHLKEVSYFLENEVYRILKKDGFFIFQTPNKYLNIPWEIISQKSLFNWRNYHCSLQTKTSLKKYLNRSGFRNIVIEKNNILTDHNKSKIIKKLGYIALPFLYILQLMPTFLFPNLWGRAQK